MKIKLFILSLLLIGFTMGSYLIPDAQNPIWVNLPTTRAGGQSISVRFSFEMSSRGLYHKEFLALVFPIDAGVELAFDALIPKYTCSLTDGTKNYLMTATGSATSSSNIALSAENYIAYCRLDDLNTLSLSADPSISYTFTVTLNFKLSRSFFQSIGLITTSSNTPEKMILDSIPVVGTLGLYADYVALGTKPFQLIGGALKLPDGSPQTGDATSIFPYLTFDTTITIGVNIYVDPNDLYLVFKYPSTVVKGPDSVLKAGGIPQNNLFAQINGNLAISKFTDNSFILTGISEILVPGRQFQVTFKNWYAMDANMETVYQIELSVFYKNTYSIISYHAIDLFKVTKTPFTMTAAHPEAHDLFRNGAWPIKFTFKPSLTLANGGWVVLQHVNGSDESAGAATSKFSFIASTCDFSSNIDVVDAFGQRQNCYALRSDFTYPDSATPTTVNGSGIFFYYKNIRSATTITITVWGYVDHCAGTNYNILDSTNTASSTLNFQASIYGKINNLNRFEGRFGQPIAQTPATAMDQKCYNSVIQGSTNGSDSDLPNYFGDNWMQANSFSTSGVPSSDYLYFKEHFDWSVGYNPDKAICSGTCWVNDIAANSASFKDAFLYSNTSANVINGNSYFLLKLGVNKVSNTDKIMNLLPTPHYKLRTGAGTVLSPYAYTNQRYPGRLVLQFSKNWFTVGEDFSSCYLAWGAVYHSIAATNKQRTLIYNYATKAAVDTVQSATPSYPQYNFIHGLTGQVDTSFSSVDRLSSNIFRIVSSYNSGALTNGEGFSGTAGTDSRWAFLYEATQQINGLTAFNIGLNTNCVKWIATPPAVKSLYSYIDIQIKWNYVAGGSTTDGGKTIRNIRLIKLFPEGYVFNDVAKISDGTYIGTANPFVNHVAYSESSMTTGVCLWEVDTTILYYSSDFSATSSTNQPDTLAFWIGFGTLLESDYNDTSAAYPVAPLVTGITAYGLQSAQPFSVNNHYAKVINSSANYAISGLLQSVQGGGVLKSSYHFYMGSVLLLTGIKSPKITSTTANSYPPLLIPYYCPLANDGNNFSNGYVPTIIASWLNMPSHQNISKLNRFIGYTNNGNTINVSSSVFGPKNVGTASSNRVAATLRFNQYTSTSDSVLNIYNAALGNQATISSVTCSGFVFLISESISIDPKITNFTATGLTLPNWGIFNISNASKSRFYANGRLFNKAVLLGQRNRYSTIASGSLANTTGQWKINGIKRPTVDIVISNANGLIDTIGFYCTSSAASDVKYLTNHFYSPSNGNNVNNFIVDLNPSTDLWLNADIRADKNQIFKNDKAGNMIITANPPGKIPAGSVIKFTASTDALNVNSVCGVVLPNSLSSSCSINLNAEVSCTLPLSGTQFKICCYNVAILNDSITLVTLTASVPIPNISGISNFISNPLYNAVNNIQRIPNLFLYSTNYSNLPDFLATSFATVTRITYIYVQQNQGIGKAIFTVQLPRELVRGMKLTLTGDFTAMAIPNFKPRCIATFSDLPSDSRDIDPQLFNSDPTKGDLLIDACSTSNFSAKANQIVVTTKNLLYTCGQAFSNRMNIMVWPVILADFSKPPLTTTSFTVLMTLTYSGEVIANSNRPFTMPSQGTLLDKPIAQLWETIATMTLTYPHHKLPAAIVDYNFTFDLTYYKKIFIDARVAGNEINIFFDQKLYGNEMPIVECYFNGVLNNCSYDYEGILAIRFSTELPTDVPFTIKLVGIKNPNIPSDYVLFFPITISQTDFNTNTRQNILVGTCKFLGGFNLANVPVGNIGNLRFKTVSIPITDRNPRNSATHTFRVAFDNAVALTGIPNSITNLKIILDFPDQYDFVWYDNTISATVDEYVVSSTYEVTKSRTVPTKTIIRSGNNIIIPANEASTIFPAGFVHYDIILSNVPSPRSDINAGMYFVTFTNDELTSVYRTHSNINTIWTDPLGTKAVDSWLAYARGNAFKYDKTKWVIDIISELGDVNNLIVRSGRYVWANFVMKDDTTGTLAADYTTVTLNDRLFKTMNANYVIASTTKQPMRFLIGAPCGTTPGYYVARFDSTNGNFVNMPLIEIYVDNSPSYIAYASDPNGSPTIASGGSMFIKLTLEYPTFDALNVKWKNPTDFVLDGGSSIQDLMIYPYSEIDISDINSTNYNNLFLSRCNVIVTSTSSTLTKQIFQGQDPNTCYTWLNPRLEVGIKDVPVDPPQQFVDNFTFDNSLTDDSIALNAMKFTFTPSVWPLYSYCALTCLSNDFPADIYIVAPRVKPSPLLRFYSDFYNDRTPKPIVFDGLVRGMQYKLRCVLKSVHAKETQRSSSGLTIDKVFYFNGNETVNQYFITSMPNPTTCVQLNFNNDIPDSYRTQLVKYCQNKFSAPGFLNNGGVICTDLSAKIIPAGYSFPKITCNDALAAQAVNSKAYDVINRSSNSRLRYLQVVNDIIPYNNTVAQNTSAANLPPINTTLFTVCAISSPLVNSNGATKTSFVDTINALANEWGASGKLATFFNVTSVPFNSTTIVADNYAPQLDNLSIYYIGYNVSGNTQWIANYNSNTNTPVRCSWMIGTSNIAPSFSSIRLCKDNVMCGTHIVNPMNITISTPASSLNYASAYYLYYICYNELPYAQKVTPVKRIFWFVTDAAPRVVNPIIVNNFENQNCNLTGTCNSGMLYSVSISLLLLILGLLI